MIRHVSFMNNYFNFFIKLAFLSLILLIANSCGIYRPAPVKDVPTNVKDRVKKIKMKEKASDLVEIIIMVVPSNLHLLILFGEQP